ncbi:hypothetical protein MHYP_G00361310 [Metynnis hypsauchen]
MMFFIMMFMLSVKGNRAADVISPYTAAVFTSEGENVTLSCNYSGSVRYLYWLVAWNRCSIVSQKCAMKAISRVSSLPQSAEASLLVSRFSRESLEILFNASLNCA